MKTKTVISTVSVCLVSWCIAGMGLAQTPPLGLNPGAMHKKELERTRNTIVAWLECIDCRDGELQAVLALGDTAVPYLVQALLGGPSPASREVMRQHLVESFQSLQQNAPSHNTSPLSSQQDYVQDYMDNYIAAYRIRASIALGKIGGPEAEEALLAVATFFRPDVEKEIKRSLGTIGLKPVP